MPHRVSVGVCPCPGQSSLAFGRPALHRASSPLELGAFLSPQHSPFHPPPLSPSQALPTMRFAVVLSAAVVLISCASAAPLLHFDLDVPSLSLFSRFFASLHPLFEPRLVQTCHECSPYWTTELGKQWLFFRGIKYFDLNAEYEKGPLPLRAFEAVDAKFPSEVYFRKQLNSTVFPEISEDGPRSNLEKFTSFRTRYYRSQTGRDSQLWLMGKAEELASTRKDLDITVSEVKHDWGQNSIVVHIPGKGKAADKAAVTILGAHQDSTNLIPFLAAPGADDDGSGTVTLLEALRVLLVTGWAPTTPVEFHWYSAEEGGLLGSQEVVRTYMEKEVKVKAMLQQDMTAFVKTGTQERVGLGEWRGIRGHGFGTDSVFSPP